MVNLILKFVSCCRASDIRISTSEVLDCLSQLQLIDILDEEQFKAVLRSNFAKSRREQSRLDSIYHLFFHEMRQDMGIAERDSLSKHIEDIFDMLEEQAGEDVAAAAIRDFLSGDPLAYLRELRRIQREFQDSTGNTRFNLGPLASRLQMLIHLNNTRGAIARFLDDNHTQITRENRRNLMAHFNGYLDSAYAMLMNEPRPYEDTLKQVRAYEKRLKKLGEKSFSLLTQKEIEEMREIIELLVRRLKDIMSRRFASNDRGVLDVKKTLRRSAKYQGIPVEIMFRKRPPRKGKIVTLCDVSSSVWSAARFMLNILYSLQECFTKVKSFIFVSGLAEVTEIFEKYEINQAIEKVLSEADIEYNVPTDYGETFRNFRKSHMDILNKKTTLIIIGDARSNYFSAEDGILEEMREKSRRVIWLNPEPEQTWYTGDSEMYAYKQHCNEVRPCRNLNQLLDFVEDLIL
jgi:uncharacterized protein with von Willebrand factor type A (vWA) domain